MLKITDTLKRVIRAGYGATTRSLRGSLGTVKRTDDEPPARGNPAMTHQDDDVLERS